MKPLPKIILAASTGESLSAYTLEALCQARNSQGHTALAIAAAHNNLDKIAGGVTAEQLASARNDDGTTALHLAAGCGSLHQVKHGATAEQLKAAKDSNGRTALENAAYWGRLDGVTGGVTLEHLTTPNARELTIAVYGVALDQIAGGVTAHDLVRHGGSLLLTTAIRSGCLHQLKGCVTLEYLEALPAMHHHPLSLLMKLIQNPIYRHNVARTAELLLFCPEALKFVEPTCPEHLNAVRLAINKRPSFVDSVPSDLLAAIL